MSTLRGASALSVAAVLLAVTGCHSSGSKAAAGSPSATSAAPDIILPSDPTSPPAAASPVGGPASTTGPLPTSATPKSPTTTSGSRRKDPCVLVTAADIAKVTGLSVGAPRPSDVGTQKLCSYSHSDPDQDNEFSVLVTVVRDPETRDDMETGRKLSAATTVAGLGSDAYWDEQMATLYVLAGSQVFEVAFGGSNAAVDASAKASSIAVARFALTRL